MAAFKTIHTLLMNLLSFIKVTYRTVKWWDL